MSTDVDISKVLDAVAGKPPGPTVDVFGATVEFLSWSDEFCVLRGVVPAGAVVPLHRHADGEDFFVLSGTQQVLVQEEGGLVRVPGNVWHACHH